MTLLSAVVCSYNRCESLRDTLRSLKEQSVGGDLSLEIIVVDNNSTDRTRQIVEEAAADSPWPIRYIFETRQGIAYARNRGLHAAQGEYVAFIDDDAVADPDWAASVFRCFEETKADMVGGKVIPLWLAEKPAWITNDLLGPMPRVDYGPARKRCAPQETFLTTNCALRRPSAIQYGVFDSTLGRRGQRWVGGEDLELCQRWIGAGAVVTYEPSAIVHHKVGPERMTPAFYRRWFEDIGYTQAHQMSWKPHFRISVMPVWRWKEFFSAGVNYFKTRAPLVPEEKKLHTELWWIFQKSF